MSNSCDRCRHPFSYAAPRSDNPDQSLCAECCAHLRAGGAWSMIAPAEPKPLRFVPWRRSLQAALIYRRMERG